MAFVGGCSARPVCLGSRMMLQFLRVQSGDSISALRAEVNFDQAFPNSSPKPQPQAVLEAV